MAHREEPSQDGSAELTLAQRFLVFRESLRAFLEPGRRVSAASLPQLIVLGLACPQASWASSGLSCLQLGPARPAECCQ